MFKHVIHIFTFEAISNPFPLILLLQMENPVTNIAGNQSLKGLAMTSDHPPLWTGVYPNFFPNYEVNCVTFVSKYMKSCVQSAC